MTAWGITVRSASGGAPDAEARAHPGERDRLLRPAALDHLPEGGVRLERDVFPVFSLDTDDDGRRAAVSSDDHVLSLGEVDALPDLLLQVAHVDGFHRMSSVVAWGGFLRTARTTTVLS